ncbi:DNA repair protein crb2 like [Verticillium longisporum]|nr:DNA repair protein crb2 like [Verticillium longisporum]
MPRYQSLAQAERAALNGDDESQDSQHIMALYIQRFGVGQARQAPQDPTPEPTSETSELHTTAATTPQQPPPLLIATPAPNKPSSVRQDGGHARNDDLQSATNDAPTITTKTPTPRADPGEAPSDTSTKIRLRKPKMDTSQSSPTQENDDRDYRKYESHSQINTSPQSTASRLDDAAIEDAPLEPQIEEEKNLDDDETGAVNFGNLGHLFDHDIQATQESSPIPYGTGPLNTRGAWRRRASSSQNQSSMRRPEGQTPYKTMPWAPETPAPPANPFAGLGNLGVQPLAPSQLFGQTQGMSSAFKGGDSPTSSRPSPNLPQHLSISPNPIETSPLKRQFNITSPTVIHTSSPQAPSSAADHFPAETPAPSRWVDDEAVAETPIELPSGTLRRRVEPMAHYETMKKSQERRLSGGALPPVDSQEDSDDALEAMQRSKRAAMKKRAAAEQLSGISLRRTIPNDDPDITPRPQRSQRRAQVAITPENECEVAVGSENEEDISTVADSQDPLNVPDTVKKPTMTNELPVEKHAPPTAMGSSVEAIPDSTEETTHNRAGKPLSVDTSETSSKQRDRIPETSPVNRPTTQVNVASPERDLVLEEVCEDPSPAAMDEDSPLATPDEPRPSLSMPSRRSSRKSRPTAKAAATDSKDKPKADEPNIQSDPSIVLDSSPPVRSTEPAFDLPSSPPLLTPRLPRGPSKLRSHNTVDQNPATPVAPESPVESAPESTSTLSTLSVTPSLSSKTTPATQQSDQVAHTSPMKPRSRHPRPSLPPLNTAPVISERGKKRTKKQTRRSTRHDSASTDELARSPSAVGFENSMAHPPKAKSRADRLSTLIYGSRAPEKDQKLFSGMAFAISFQSKRPGENTEQYEERLSQSNDIEKKILEYGGRLLSSGFDELFDAHALRSAAVSPVTDEEEEASLTLATSAQTLGFTALIADGHSRKVKYMQALALGLPCISDRWVTTCVEKQKVVAWDPYLLCAGQSSFLRDAIRSRYLAPYPATDARLVDVIERRPQLLQGSRILLIMKKSRQEDKKMPYVFLAHVLGASLARAYKMDEAKRMMREKELLEAPFDWVYVDENTGTDEELFMAVPPTQETRKRKRVSAGGDSAPPPKRIRTLSDELVIQSLILGRMIEEEELEG